MQTVKLVSGGIDSYIMSQEYNGLNIYIDFGQKYAKHEIAALKDLGVDFETIVINSNYKEKEIFIPDRNLAMVSIVAMIYEPDVIMLAGLLDDNCVDKTPEAFNQMSEIISKFANKEIKVISPYFNLTKGQLIEQYSDKEKLKYTFSCYNPLSIHQPCGNCPACLRKAIALETNGVNCGYELTDKIVCEYFKKINQYNADRVERFFTYLEKSKPVLWEKLIKKVTDK